MDSGFGDVDANAVAGDAGDAVDFGAGFADVGGHGCEVVLECLDVVRDYRSEGCCMMAMTYLLVDDENM